MIFLITARESGRVKVLHMSVCPVSVFEVIMFAPIDLLTSYFVCKWVTTISRLGLSTKVIGPRSRQWQAND